MPTYEYQCSACEHRFEQFQSMKDKPLRTCPSCKKPKLERLIGTGGAIIFKGGGFYQTDYRSESYKKSAEAEKSAGGSGDGAKPAASTSGGESATGAKSDAKPAKSESSSKSAGGSGSAAPAGSAGAKKSRKSKAE